MLAALMLLAGLARGAVVAAQRDQMQSDQVQSGAARQ